MKKGQITIDLLMAIFLALFLLSWIESYHFVQYQEAQRQGASQETASIAISEGSIMNTFYAMNTGEDHAELPGLETTQFLDEITTTKQTVEGYLQVNAQYEEERFQYSYPVPLGVDYYEECEEPEGIEDDPCVR